MTLFDRSAPLIRFVLGFIFFRFVVGAFLHVDPEVIIGQGYAIPPYIHRIWSVSADAQAIQRHRPAKVVKTVSQFDEPGGWKPVLEKYDMDLFEPATQQFVTGSPSGRIPIFS